MVVRILTMKGMKMSDTINKTRLVELNRAHYAKAIVEFVKESNRAPLFNSVKLEISIGW
jgi:ribosomal protein S17